MMESIVAELEIVLRDSTKLHFEQLENFLGERIAFRHQGIRDPERYEAQ